MISVFLLFKWKKMIPGLLLQKYLAEIVSTNNLIIASGSLIEKR